LDFTQRKLAAFYGSFGTNWQIFTEVAGQIGSFLRKFRDKLAAVYVSFGTNWQHSTEVSGQIGSFLQSFGTNWQHSTEVSGQIGSFLRKLRDKLAAVYGILGTNWQLFT